MKIHKNFANGVLLTKGLGGGAKNMVVAQLRLGRFFEVVIEDQQPTTGGSIPIPPGKSGEIFNPVRGQIPYITPKYYKGPVIKVTITTTFNGNVHVKEMFVQKYKAAFLVNTINIINVTKQKMSATAKSVKRIANRIKVRVFNLRNKHK